MKRVLFAIFVIWIMETCACASGEVAEESYDGESDVEQTTFSISSGKAVYVYVPKTVQQNPQLFAAIAPMGWMSDVQNVKELYQTWDMPFQVIQGTKDYTYATESGDMAIMEDEQRSIRDLLLLNEMIEEKDEPNYAITPYWGYCPKQTATKAIDGWQWNYSNYYKAGYTAPFAQLVLIEGAEHTPNINEAKVAWDFFRHFKREKSGAIVEAGKTIEPTTTTNPPAVTH